MAKLSEQRASKRNPSRISGSEASGAKSGPGETSKAGRSKRNPTRISGSDVSSGNSDAGPSTRGSVVEFAGVRLTHPERVLWEEQGLTKQQLAEYYLAIAEFVLPHVVGRPLALVRCP